MAAPFTVTTAQVADFGKFPLPAAGVELELLEQTLAATEAILTRDFALPYVLETVDGEEVPVDPLELEPADLALCNQAIMMQTTRLWKRRETPEGISQFAGEFGPMRVTRFDPDLEALVGGWRKFPVG